MRDSWVHEELQRYPDDADDGQCNTDTRWRHGKTASKVKAVRCEARWIWMSRVEARCGEVDSPEAVEGTYVHGQNAVRAESSDKVACPYATER
jgi:hypothetical protein